MQAEGSWTRLHPHLLPQGGQRMLQPSPTPPLSHATPAPGAHGSPTSHRGAPQQHHFSAGRSAGAGAGGSLPQLFVQVRKGGPQALPSQRSLSSPSPAGSPRAARSHSASETLWLPILCPHVRSLTPPCMIFPDSDWN